MKKKEKLLQKLESLKRKTWKPVVKKGDKRLTASKFSGTPYFLSGEEWPLCGNCKRPMQLFVQLNIAELPEEFRSLSEMRDGLLQMFYCVSKNPPCSVDCEAYNPFSRSSLVRMVKIVGENVDLDNASSGGQLTFERDKSKKYFPAKTITGWEEMEDYPMYYEIERHGILFSKEEEKLFQGMDFPAQGEKLYGWPYWVQDIEYPDCPLCGKKMGFIFQVDSQDNLPYEFGDSGCGHIFQCGEHKGTLGFGWECC